MSKTIFPLFVIAFSATILAGLGTWQMQRLEFKRELIGRVEQRMAYKPQNLRKVEEIYAATGDVEYYQVEIFGRFLHDLEQHYYTTRDGKPGWHIFTPLLLENTDILFVNRGFVPVYNKEPDTRSMGQISNPVMIKGTSRNAPIEKPNRLVPENNFDTNIYYWRSLKDMIKRAGFSQGQKIVPFFVDSSALGSLPGGPQGGTTLLSFPNNHLQYAITWYGLCLSVIGVGGGGYDITA